MLVLSRRKNERIMIGSDVVITVVDIRSDKVRIGVEAPSTTSVHREEVWVKIQKEQTQVRDSRSVVYP